MKELEKLIQVAKDEWPDEQWEEMGILKAEEELRAINATLLAGEHIAKMCSALRDERDAAQRKLKRAVERMENSFVCPPYLGDEPCVPDCGACWDKWVNMQEDT
jgi:hypothetical protein